MLGNTGRNEMPSVLLNTYLQMRLLKLMEGLETRPIRRLLAIAQLPFENGLKSFLEVKWRKQTGLPKSETLRVLQMKRKCICEFNFVSFKWPLMKSLLSYQKKNLRKQTVEFIKALRRTMGVHSVVLQGFKGPNSKTTLL